MATSYRHSITWDAPLADVYAMITDPAYQEQRSQAGSPVRAESSVTATGDGAEIKVFRQMGIDPPGFIKSFVGDSIGIQETQTWTSPTEGQPPGGDSQATRRRQRHRPPERVRRISTVATVEAEISVRAPLIGGKVEGYVAGILDRLLNKDEEIGRDWLARS